MKIELIPQFDIGGIQRRRIGDYLNTYIASESVNQFRFAVAYMRLSGLDRIAGALESLVNRGGIISGVIGLDDFITSFESLEALLHYSSTSTVFHTTSGFIYHPKLYMINNDDSAVVFIGSANLTLNGLFRNIELMTAIHLDFDFDLDIEVFQKYSEIFDELLNPRNQNVRYVNSENNIEFLHAGLIKYEIGSKEPGPSINREKVQRNAEQIEHQRALFPPIQVPTAPPGYGLARIESIRKLRHKPVKELDTDILDTNENIATFIMRLSSFDSSHRTNTPGTPEILIPLDAQLFFPEIAYSGRKYPDANFDVVLNTTLGQERHSYRVWFYDKRSEFRLRMNHDTIDLSDPEGGDLLVINMLQPGSDPPYEVTILSKTDASFPLFYDKCNQESKGKIWGIIEPE